MISRSSRTGRKAGSVSLFTKRGMVRSFSASHPGESDEKRLQGWVPVSIARTSASRVKSMRRRLRRAHFDRTRRARSAGIVSSVDGVMTTSSSCGRVRARIRSSSPVTRRRKERFVRVELEDEGEDGMDASLANDSEVE
jgi:hypothetical protein